MTRRTQRSRQNKEKQDRNLLLTLTTGELVILVNIRLFYRLPLLLCLYNTQLSRVHFPRDPEGSSSTVKSKESNLRKILFSFCIIQQNISFSTLNANNSIQHNGRRHNIGLNKSDKSPLSIFFKNCYSENDVRRLNWLNGRQ
jgi:hypothetical protein